MEERKFSVKELVQIFEKMPNRISPIIAFLLSTKVLDESIFSRIAYKNFYTMKRSEKFELADEIKNLDLIKALSNWNWDSHPPHTDDAILVLVEELLEKYRDCS